MSRVTQPKFERPPLNGLGLSEKLQCVGVEDSAKARQTSVARTPSDAHHRDADATFLESGVTDALLQAKVAPWPLRGPMEALRTSSGC